MDSSFGFELTSQCNGVSSRLRAPSSDNPFRFRDMQGSDPVNVHRSGSARIAARTCIAEQLRDESTPAFAPSSSGAVCRIATSCLEQGAHVESDVLRQVKSLLPEELASQIDIPRPPASAAPSAYEPTVAPISSAPAPVVTELPDDLKLDSAQKRTHSTCVLVAQPSASRPARG